MLACGDVQHYSTILGSDCPFSQAAVDASGYEKEQMLEPAVADARTDKPNLKCQVDRMACASGPFYPFASCADALGANAPILVLFAFVKRTKLTRVPPYCGMISSCFKSYWSLKMLVLRWQKDPRHVITANETRCPLFRKKSPILVLVSLSHTHTHHM